MENETRTPSHRTQSPTFTCIVCAGVRESSEQTASYWDPQEGRWRCCTLCGALRDDRCNGCGRAVTSSPGAALTLCQECLDHIGW